MTRDRAPRSAAAPRPSARPDGRTLATVALVTALGLGACTEPTPGDPSTTSSVDAGAPAAGDTPSRTAEPTDAAFAALEKQRGARVGVVVLDTGSGRTLTYRPEERFATAGSIVVVTAGLLLRDVSDGQLDTVVPIAASDVVGSSPVTAGRVGTGLPLRQVVTAAVSAGDATAANLVSARLGGPSAIQALLTSLGDDVTRVDRIEPASDDVTPGDPRDTSTAMAMATALRGLTTSELLPPTHRALLVDALVASTPTTDSLRAAVPEGWQVGDRPGVAGQGTRNDVALLVPPGRAPVVVAVLTDRPGAQSAPDDGLVAAAATIALAPFLGS